MEGRAFIFFKYFIRFFIWSLIFYCFLVIIWGSLGLGIGNIVDKSPKFMYTKLQEAKSYGDTDIVFLGSSRAYRHYDPRYFAENGYKIFNLGSSSQTFIQSEILVRRYFDLLKPELIVVDVYPSMFGSEGLESSLDLLSSGHNNFKTLVLALSHTNIQAFNTWIYQYFRQTIGLEQPEKRSDSDDIYISGGFVQRKDLTQDRKITADTIPLEYSEKQINAFHNIVDYAGGKGVKLLFLQSPMQSGITFNGEINIDSIMEAEKLEYFNYNDLKFLDNKVHFYDEMHMNSKGVELYNEFIMRRHFK